MRSILVLAAIGASAVAGIAGAARVQTPAPTTFSVTQLQAEEIAALIGFLRAYNHGDLNAALGYFAAKQIRPFPITATDCDYTRQKTEVYVARKGLVQWLRRRFADHDRLTLGRVYNENPSQAVGVVGVEYSRRTAIRCASSATHAASSRR